MNPFDVSGVPPIYQKDYLEESLLNFLKFFFLIRERIKFIVAPHHILITDTLTRVINGEINRLIINIPPSYSKTEIAVIAFMAYGFVLNPDCKFIHTSYSDSLALRNSDAVRSIIQSDEFQQYWGLNIRHDSKAKKRWDIEGGGGVYATSAKGQITGFRAGKSKPGFQGAFIIDDPIKPEDANSLLKISQINEWYNATVQSRVDNRETPIILIMQRVHEDDLSSYLLNGGSGEKWHHLCLPALI